MTPWMVDGKRFDFRLINARSWWIATELCRRHPQLAIIERHPPDGPHDSLALFDESAGRTLVDLNRAGSLGVNLPGDGKDGGDGALGFGWAEVFSTEPLRTVTRLESDAGLAAPRKRLATTGHLLSYRLITILVEASANGAQPWEVRSAYIDAPGEDRGPSRHLFEEFPGAAEQRERIGEVPSGDPARGFWAFRRRDQVEFMIDHWATLYRRERDPMELEPAFRDAGRNVWKLIAHVFADELE
ncbi:hypothetical protein NCCP1664_21130 [Zafaria cholistanensis]|uniref:T3SS peptide-binding chaperone domain-containing protein n=1 Tax=Zafaria cholistanensis TaxID=1682741 RepID=A0A5A7NUR3_9MICC|nr:hypothetical protein [Zafaria cholistanensis]GER23618.1 hypothetical protein NCCP1664_21130 [Zafaria cholistanensis]